MSIISHLQTLGATHLFDFDPSFDLVNDGTVIAISGGQLFNGLDAEINYRHSLVYCTFTTPPINPINEQVIWEMGGATTGTCLCLQTDGSIGVYYGSSQATPKLSTPVLSNSTQYSVIVELHSQEQVNIHYQSGNSFSFWSYGRTPEVTIIDTSTDYFVGTEGGGYGLNNGVAGGNSNGSVETFSISGSLDSSLYYIYPLPDMGNSLDPTFQENPTITNQKFTFEPNPVCEGFSHSLHSLAVNTNMDGIVLSNRSDINSSNSNGNNFSSFDYNKGTRSLLIWYRQELIENITSIYEQGGGTNNFAFMGGPLITFQAADAGQPFLIVQSKSLTKASRPYCLIGVWEYYTQHAGSGNRVLFYINGVLQGISELGGTDKFPGHGGDIACGNSTDSLKSYSNTSVSSQTSEKYCNLLGMFNNVSITQEQARDIFERTVLSDVTIASDTVVNQQTTLDALSGNTYDNSNCAIRIMQATDATNYRLFVDGITFVADSNIEDISVQFVGQGILTLENTNGTKIQYISTPSEVEFTTGIISGGGSIVTVDNTLRYKSNATIVNPQASKIVFDGTGTSYTIDGGIVPSYENVSGATVTATLINNAITPTTILETSGALIIQQLVTIKVIVVNAIGDPIGGARVYFEAGSGGPETQGTILLNGLTNASGVYQDTAYNYIGDQSIQNGRVRKSSSSPYYKPTTISGTITSTGISLTAVLIRDE